MNKKNKKLLWTVIIAIVAMSSCKKSGFLDANNDPNRVTDATITPELIFTSAANNVGRRTLDFGFLENWVGYFAPNGDFAPNQGEQDYNLTYTFGDPLFQVRYHTLNDLHLVESKGLASGDTAVAAASMILSAKIFQELVDLFGDIPYSQTFQIEKYPHPSYDKAKDIYDSLQLKLDKAIAYFKLPVKPAFISADIVNHGDPSKWIRFANTLKLRLLIRQSNLGSLNYASEIAKINANGNILGVDNNGNYLSGDNVTVNPGYLNDNNKQNPFYSAYGYDVTGNKVSVSTNANSYIINILSNTNDPRIGRFFTKVGSSYIGDTYGDIQANLPAGSSSSYFGPGLVGSASQDQPIYLAYQSLFLRAEAIARGWITGDASVAYKNAIVESFVYLGVPDAVNAANDYLASNGFDYASVSGNLIPAILFQKYVANTGLDPFESYSDIRRVPNFLPDNTYISINPGRLSNTLPLRLPYPQIEYTTNGDQVNKVGNIDYLHTKIFWEH